jgi:p-hydroxybenzoate 3-monooxygenase
MPERTRVAIIGAGPAGLLLSHLLDRFGIESIVVDSRTREQIETTIRAGILEQGTVEILTETGASGRVLTAGHKHEGVELHFAGEGHRIDFTDTVGRAVWLYPQHEVLKDLIATRLNAGQDLRLGVTAQRVEDAETDRPRVIVKDAEGNQINIEADVVVGADGSRNVAREAVTGTYGGYFHEYPFAWFGILCELRPAPKNSFTATRPTASHLSASAAPASSAVRP